MKSIGKLIQIFPLAIMLMVMAGNASALALPMSTTFCNIAQAMQSQWAPGVTLIVIIVEGFLLYMAKKGVMEKVLWLAICATIVFFASSWLGFLTNGNVGVGCAGVT